MFDKLLVTTLVRMTRESDMYRGPYSRFLGAQQNIETQTLRSPSCVSIMSDSTARMAFECARYQVDVIAGDGNEACYLATLKAGGFPTY